MLKRALEKKQVAARRLKRDTLFFKNERGFCLARIQPALFEWVGYSQSLRLSKRVNDAG